MVWADASLARRGIHRRHRVAIRQSNHDSRRRNSRHRLREASIFPSAPSPAPGQPPEGDLVSPAAGPFGGLSAADVTQILNNAEATANTTRAAIRLPPGVRTKMVIAVADLDGTIIGLRRMTDSTVFSIDVAATKARNMVYFNSQSRSAADLNQVPLGPR